MRRLKSFIFFGIGSLGLLAMSAFVGGLLALMPPSVLTGKGIVNRWYRAAFWAFWVICVLAGVLIIGAAVIWAISEPNNVPLLVGAILTIIVPVMGMLGWLVVGGLVVAGKIAQGNEETEEFARSWARTHGAAGARSTGENAAPE